ncbi:MAG: hypothetical protein KAS94_10230 [Desulfobulbaceae bacterium]|nr:hypothetical protein [Desulfobulbaceae bacterium]
MKRYNECIKRVLELSREMIILADDGQLAAKDDGCRLLFGILQDCAYKLRKSAEEEKAAHIRADRWDTPKQE